MKAKYLLRVLLPVFLAFLFVIFLGNQLILPVSAGTSLKAGASWITIDYGQAVDESRLTQTGETVGEIIKKLSPRSDRYKGLVQQYLEPFSILCHDALLYGIEPDTLPLTNITAHYPAGSERPAWVDLLREGHFQVYYNEDLIRVFMKVEDTEDSFKRFMSVLRYPIVDIINSEGLAVKKIEIYVFQNDYSSRELKLNTVPIILSPDEIDLISRKKPLDLRSIESFLNQGAALEAVEVNEENDVFLYGKRASELTVAGEPLSLSDIAVIYRAVFFCGYNTPYISLDKHEDNRYAKVNFGGLLEDTRAGQVVLEADKLFKTLSTGIDPNTHELRKKDFTEHLPDFLTEAERGLMKDFREGHRQIRYWFYPDEISTVTDGRIGVIQDHQFLADAERMDVDINLDRTTRETIDHLNNNYSDYEKAEATYRELSTVGRLMGLVSLFREMEVDERVELDELLAVRIPAISTPDKTKKMLAVTARAAADDMKITAGNIRDYTRTYYLSELLDKYSPATSDEEFLDIGGSYFSEMYLSELYLPFDNIEVKLDRYKEEVAAAEEEIEQLYEEIAEKEKTLNRYNQSDIDQYNELVDRYNDKIKEQQELINLYNEKAAEFNKIGITHSISIGGGIELNPAHIKHSVTGSDTTAIQEIVNVRNQLKAAGEVSTSGDWIRSNPVNRPADSVIINKLPFLNWSLSKSGSDPLKYSYRSAYGDLKEVSFSEDLNQVEYTVSVNGDNSAVKLYRDEKRIEVSHGILPFDCRGEVSADGEYFFFEKAM